MLDEIISLLKSGFPAREVFLLMKGKGSLLGKNILAREGFLARKKNLSLPEKGSHSGKRNLTA